VKVNFEGLKFEISMSSPRSKVWSSLWSQRSEVGGVKSKVEGMRYEVFVSSWRFEINGLKCEVLCQSLEVFLCKVKGWRYLCARSKARGIFVRGQRLEVSLCEVKGQRSDEGLNFECYLCEVWGLSLKRFF
jgi:hypothetical protein